MSSRVAKRRIPIVTVCTIVGLAVFGVAVARLGPLYEGEHGVLPGRLSNPPPDHVAGAAHPRRSASVGARERAIPPKLTPTPSESRVGSPAGRDARAETDDWDALPPTRRNERLEEWVRDGLRRARDGDPEGLEDAATAVSVLRGEIYETPGGHRLVEEFEGEIDELEHARR